MAAYAMTKINFPGRKGMFQLVYYSLMFNSTVSALSNFIIMSAFGWIDTYWSLIIPAFGYTLGFYLMRQFMETTVPDSVLESARLDGAKEWTIYMKIVMPMVKPAWLTLIVGTAVLQYIYTANSLKPSTTQFSRYLPAV